MKTMGKVLVVSVKPEFAEKIFTGEKSIELRKSTPNVSPGDIVVVYCTSPVKAVVGICQVKEIIKLKPSAMWRIHNCVLGIDKKRYEEYYNDAAVAVGIVLKSVSKLDQNISLIDIRKMFPLFQPPQTFRYLSKSTLFKTFLSQAV
jgi:predicted transcriptional regulator